MNRRTNVTKPQAKAQPAPEAKRVPGPASEAVAQAEIERLVEQIVARQLNRLLRQAAAPASQINAESERPASVTDAAKQPADAHIRASGAKAAREGALNNSSISAMKARAGEWSDGLTRAAKAGEGAYNAAATGAEAADEGAYSDGAIYGAKVRESTYNNAAIYAAKVRADAQNSGAVDAEDAGEDDGVADAARAREDALDRREAELDRRELRAWVADEMRIRELPAELAEVVDLSDVRRCADAVDALEKAFRQAVQRGVDERINRSGRTLPRSTGDVPAGMSQRMRAAAGLM